MAAKWRISLLLLLAPASALVWGPRRGISMTAQPSSSVEKPYPTKASEVVNYSTVKSVLVRHVLCASADLADNVLRSCRSAADGRDALSEVAAALSMCEESKKQGGELGWVSPEDDFLDDRFPKELRKTVSPTSHNSTAAPRRQGANALKRIC
eukprot:scaffold1712_cov261-Pinguiococcus_pyrenoidosus.AAC.9